MRELIINLHGIGEPPAAVDANEKPYWWSVEAFNLLLDQISGIPANTDPRVSLTFDDGNASDALLALPRLHRSGLFASFFVCAGRVGKRHYLDRSMIRDLLDAGMGVGSHGMNHVDWRTISSTDLEVEISGARKMLEAVVEQPITMAAIPFGSYDRRVLRRLKQERFDFIYTSDGGIADATSVIKPRETVDKGMQDCDVILEFMKSTPLRSAARALSRLYKRIR